MSSQQPVFAAKYVERRNRLTTFFRLILAIPHVVVLYVWELLTVVAIVIAWFALVITGRWPAALYGFVAAFQRYSTGVYGYVSLLTDEYPPFSGETSAYPVSLRIAPPKPQYSRLKAFFRLILAIPVAIIIYAMALVWQIGAFLAWFAIVALGRQPRGLQEMIVLGLSYQQRAYCYLSLLTEDWPPFTDPGRRTLTADEDPSVLPSAAPTPMHGDFAPPTADPEGRARPDQLDD